MERQCRVDIKKKGFPYITSGRAVILMIYDQEKILQQETYTMPIPELVCYLALEYIYTGGIIHAVFQQWPQKAGRKMTYI